LILAAGLRIYQINDRDFWYDEAFTGIAVRERFHDMMGDGGNYYLNHGLTVVATDERLQQCELKSILISAMRTWLSKMRTSASRLLI
jgi:hypothetical protein